MKYAVENIDKTLKNLAFQMTVKIRLGDIKNLRFLFHSKARMSLSVQMYGITTEAWYKNGGPQLETTGFATVQELAEFLKLNGAIEIKKQKPTKGVIRFMTEFTLKPLIGHTSEETAFLVDDYPYGFRLRCKIRYWLEYKPGIGFRFCYQTTNPNMAGDFWNKPKKSTYRELAIMGLGENDHVTWHGISMYYPEELAQFVAAYGESLDSNQKNVARAMNAAFERHTKAQAARMEGKTND